MNNLALEKLKPNKPFPVAEYELPDNWDIAKLNRQATAFKTEKKWQDALLCLYQVRAVADKSREPVMIATLLRLPLFLQQAGYFEAAKYELSYLLKNMDKFIKREIKGLLCPDKQLVFYREIYFENIYEKAALIFKREKDKETANYFADLANQHKEKRIIANQELMEARRAEIDRMRGK